MPDLQQYDAIVIGAGQGGGPLAGALARADRSTALIERKHVGGSCVNEGCTPTKTMVASARVAHLARRAADYGVRTGPVSVDLKAVRRRKRDMVERFRSGSRSSLERIDGLDLIEGEAAFTGAKTLTVTFNDGSTQPLYGDTVAINTGERPLIPPIDGLPAVDYLDSTSVMELDSVPEHLIVLGGGYIGLEFGQMFRRFGSRVTLVEMADRLLRQEDADVAEAVTEILEEDGIDVRVSTTVTRAEQHDDGTISTRLENDDGGQTLHGSHLLIAAGRRPNTDRLNLEAAGVQADERGYVRTNDRLETTAEGVYALGDVKGGPAFTHISYDDYRVLRDNLIDGGGRSIEGRLVPYTVFIDPQLGRVGLGEEQAREEDRDIRVARLPMARVARALETGETRGFMKAVVDPDSKQILGATVLGPEGGEVMSALQMAIMGGVPYTRIRDAAFSHPTLTESLNNLFSGL